MSWLSFLSDAQKRANADRHRNEHGDLAQGIESPEVDENHVHHVTSMPERRSVVSEVPGRAVTSYRRPQ